VYQDGDDGRYRPDEYLTVMKVTVAQESIACFGSTWTSLR
jgi:hypothetical protein